MWLLLSAERIDAQEAYRIGLVNKVVPRDQVLQTAREWADLLASRAPLAVQAAKQAALGGVELPLTGWAWRWSRSWAPGRAPARTRSKACARSTKSERRCSRGV